MKNLFLFAFYIGFFWGFFGVFFGGCWIDEGCDLDLPFVDPGVLHLDGPVIVVGVGGLRTRDPVLGRQEEALKLVPYPDILQEGKKYIVTVESYCPCLRMLEGQIFLKLFI